MYNFSSNSELIFFSYIDLLVSFYFDIAENKLITYKHVELTFLSILDILLYINKSKRDSVFIKYTMFWFQYWDRVENFDRSYLLKLKFIHFILFITFLWILFFCLKLGTFLANMHMCIFYLHAKYILVIVPSQIL